MDTYEDPYVLYFYLHIPIVYDLGVLVPFTSFETKFLTTVNMAPHRLLQIPREYLGLFR